MQNSGSNKLYVGVDWDDNDGVHVYAYDGNEWVDTEIDDGAVNEQIVDMVVYDGRLYCSTLYQGNGCEIWSYEGSTWRKEMSGGFGDSNNVNGNYIVVHNGRLIVGTTNEATGGEVWQYDSQTQEWSQINADGFGDPTNIATVCIGTYNNELYVSATNAAEPGSIWKYNGTSWVPVPVTGMNHVISFGFESNNTLFVGDFFGNPNIPTTVWQLGNIEYRQTWYKDADGDGYSDGTSQEGVSRPGADYYLREELTSTTGDLNDDNPSVYPGATEICDGVDNDCDGETDEACNNLPVATAGDDKAVKIGDTAHLDASGSYDPDGDTLTYSWSVTSPTGNPVTLSNSSSVDPAFTATETGTYTAQLTVDDGISGTDSDTVQITCAASDYINSVGMTFNLIPAGTFTMGSPTDEPRDNDETQHMVTLTQAFYMQTTEVTQAQWETIMGNNPSHFSNCPNCPVEMVSWDDAQDFITALNSKGEGIYSLPTEAQWEYAARAGSKTAFENGGIAETGCDYDPNLDLMGWYCYNSLDNTHEVAQKAAPNAWGLYDMHGNVWEWCQDWYGQYSTSHITDPEGPENGTERVLRGGGWPDPALACRSAARVRDPIDETDSDTGFRLIRIASGIPTATITSPSNGSEFDAGTSISFTGTGDDPEDGTLTGDSLVWTSNIDGVIGTSESVTTSSLSTGDQVITLTATDSEGMTRADAISITIYPGPINLTGTWEMHENFGDEIVINVVFLQEGNTLVWNLECGYNEGTFEINGNEIKSYDSEGSFVTGIINNNGTEMNGQIYDGDELIGEWTATKVSDAYEYATRGTMAISGSLCGNTISADSDMVCARKLVNEENTELHVGLQTQGGSIGFEIKAPVDFENFQPATYEATNDIQDGSLIFVVHGSMIEDCFLGQSGATATSGTVTIDQYDGAVLKGSFNIQLPNGDPMNGSFDVNMAGESVWYKDSDEDGYSDGTLQSSVERPGSDYYLPEELIAIEGDLNDDKNTVYPGATEICDGVDNDCDGETDEGGVCGGEWIGKWEYVTYRSADCAYNFVLDFREDETFTIEGGDTCPPSYEDDNTYGNWRVEDGNLYVTCTTGCGPDMLNSERISPIFMSSTGALIHSEHLHYSVGATNGIIGTWEKQDSGCNISITFNNDGTFNTIAYNCEDPANDKVVQGNYTVDGDRLTFSETPWSYDNNLMYYKIIDGKLSLGEPYSKLEELLIDFSIGEKFTYNVTSGENSWPATIYIKNYEAHDYKMYYNLEITNEYGGNEVRSVPSRVTENEFYIFEDGAERLWFQTGDVGHTFIRDPERDNDSVEITAFGDIVIPYGTVSAYEFSVTDAGDLSPYLIQSISPGLGVVKIIENDYGTVMELVALSVFPDNPK